jgi:hypothetical protein
MRALVPNPAIEDRKAVPIVNALAFLFGPFYYLVKGMWRKALTLLLLSVIGESRWILIHGGTQFLGTRMTRPVDPPDLRSTR